MLDTPQDVFIVIVGLACSLSFMAAVNYYWPAEKRRPHNDLIGWQLSVLGTTYAVIVGFMLYTVWINFGAADLNADAEANSLVNVYRLSDGLPRIKGQNSRASRGHMATRLWTMSGQRWQQTTCPRKPARSLDKCGGPDGHERSLSHGDHGRRSCTLRTQRDWPDIAGFAWFRAHRGFRWCCGLFC